MDNIIFNFEGCNVRATPGDSIAAALTEAGYTSFGWRRSGEARGHYCGMGVCHDCIMTVDGQRGVRACMKTVANGTVVLREDECRLANSTVPTPASSFETLEAEIAIIGAGPAGLSATIRAANAGADVVVLDERDEPGGQYFKPRSHGYRGRHKLDRQHQRGLLDQQDQRDLRDLRATKEILVGLDQRGQMAQQDQRDQRGQQDQRDRQGQRGLTGTRALPDQLGPQALPGQLGLRGVLDYLLREHT